MINKIDKICNEEIMNLKHIDSSFKDEMIYSLIPGGKHIRSLLFLNILSNYRDLTELDYRFASVFELIHTFTLIHDDLPALDNDDLRRGRASHHKKYSEASAILAGDSLLALAGEILFDISAQNDKYLSASRFLFNCIGSQGVIYGEYLDVKYDKSFKSEKMYNEIVINKTAKFFEACLVCPQLILGNKDLEVFSDLGIKLGILFQIQDDILDVESSADVLGKNIGKDKLQNKLSYVNYHGLEEAKKKTEELKKYILEKFNENNLDLSIIEGIFKRRK